MIAPEAPRREVREAIGWGNTQLKVHLHRLEELEYIAAHRAQAGQGFVYELLYEGQGKDGALFLMGLTDVETHPGEATLEDVFVTLSRAQKE